MKKFMLFAVALTVLFAGCAAKSADVVKIGGIFPLSGPVAVYGIGARNGVELAIKEINAAGGIDGKQVVLISEDDEGNPEKSVNAFKKLTTKDKVKFVIGSLTSGCTIAITDLAQTQGVVLIAPAATNEKVTDAGNYIFRACFIDPFQGTVGGKFAATELKAKNAAVLYDVGNDYSIGLYENFKKAFEAAGGKVVVAESYNTGDKDFNAQLTKIKSAKPDVVYLPDYYATVALIAKQLRSQGVNAPIVGGDGWGGITDNAGDEVLNGYYSDHYAADSTAPNVVKFVNAFKAAYNETPVSFAALGYDCMFMLKDAMVAAKTTTNSEAVRNALEKTNGSYVTGNLTFDAKHNPVKSAVMNKIIKAADGSLAVVYNSTVNP